MIVEVRYQKPPEFLPLDFRESFWKKAKKAVEAGILDNILNQKQVDGKPIKKNAPATLAKKRVLGVGSRSLIATDRRFVQRGGGSWAWGRVLTSVKGKVVGFTVRPATLELDRLNMQVQALGYTGWFGVTRMARLAIKVLIHKELEYYFRKVVTKNRKRGMQKPTFKLPKNLKIGK